MADRPIIFSAPMVRALLAGTKTQTRRVLKPQPQGVNRIGVKWPDGVLDCDGRRLPYAPGDRLWCREAHVITPAGIAYVADGVEHYGAGGALPKRPSIHMPRRLSRLTLHVTEVRVQRLQEISRGDAMGEGCPFPNMADGPNPIDWFHGLWNSLHGPDAWDANPWVCAITFTVERANIDHARHA